MNILRYPLKKIIKSIMDAATQQQEQIMALLEATQRLRDRVRDQLYFLYTRKKLITCERKIKLLEEKSQSQF